MRNTNKTWRVIFFTSAMLLSCGGDFEPDYESFKPALSEKILSAKTTDIAGEFGPYFTLNTSKTKVTYLGSRKQNNQEWVQEWKIRVNIAKSNVPLPDKAAMLNQMSFSLTIYDAASVPISGLSILENKSDFPSANRDLLLTNAQDFWVSYIIQKGTAYEEAVIANWQQFTVAFQHTLPNSSAAFQQENQKQETQNTPPIVASSSKAWDEMLDDYESYVRSFITYYGKATKTHKNGELQYPELIRNVTLLQKNMNKAKNNKELRPDQIERMQELQIKMTNAALDF
ncbi:hypothetical protein ACFSQP_06350 [Bizionia sediminis]|uniref:DUF4843 domain-containing protein n=1 Tax=Bizionia sediminis TaxID=1737064 RepID=A0ABW5KS37_9FLAO